jgi:hypothetical protein
MVRSLSTRALDQQHCGGSLMREHRRQKLHTLIAEHEDRLMASILHYALAQGYAAYTSTLVEAWRLSIHGLSKPLLDALGGNHDTLELSPDEDYKIAHVGHDLSEIG